MHRAFTITFDYNSTKPDIDFYYIQDLAGAHFAAFKEPENIWAWLRIVLPEYIYIGIPTPWRSDIKYLCLYNPNDETYYGFYKDTQNTGISIEDQALSWETLTGPMSLSELTTIFSKALDKQKAGRVRGVAADT